MANRVRVQPGDVVDASTFWIVPDIEANGEQEVVKQVLKIIKDLEARCPSSARYFDKNYSESLSSVKCQIVE